MTNPHQDTDILPISQWVIVCLSASVIGWGARHDLGGGSKGRSVLPRGEGGEEGWGWWRDLFPDLCWSFLHAMRHSLLQSFLTLLKKHEWVRVLWHWWVWGVYRRCQNRSHYNFTENSSSWDLTNLRRLFQVEEVVPYSIHIHICNVLDDQSSDLTVYRPSFLLLLLHKQPDWYS